MRACGVAGFRGVADAITVSQSLQTATDVVRLWSLPVVVKSVSSLSVAIAGFRGCLSLLLSVCMLPGRAHPVPGTQSMVVVEKRDRFSRNNVLHLWPYNIHDLRGLGAKKFYGKFCAGAIDHISIRQLQCMLLKVALLLGVEVLAQPFENSNKGRR